MFLQLFSELRYSWWSQGAILWWYIGFQWGLQKCFKSQPFIPSHSTLIMYHISLPNDVALISKAHVNQIIFNKNYLGISFTTIWVPCYNFVGCESFHKWISSVICALFKTNLEDSFGFTNFFMDLWRDFFFHVTLLWKFCRSLIIYLC